MSDIKIYENQAAIDALTPMSGDLVVNRGTSTLHLCTGRSPVSWKIFTPGEGGPFGAGIVDTEENIYATDVTNPSGEYTLAFGTDTDDLYVWTGTIWVKFSNN